MEPVRVVTADFDNDKIPDLAMVGWESNDMRILLGRGDGTFRFATNVRVEYGSGSVTVDDFNGDELPDLALASIRSNTVSILLGNGDGTFRPAQIYEVGFHATSVAVGDFNGDEIQDLATTSWRDAGMARSAVSTLLGNGDGTFQPAQYYAVGLRPGALKVADFNNDKIQDLVAINQYSHTVSILLGMGL